MKLQLKSLNNTTTEIEVSGDDTVDTIRQKLVEAGKVNADSVVKLIESGSILDLDKKISDYPNLKDGKMVVFMQTKKKLSENKPQAPSQSSNQSTVSQPASNATTPNAHPSIGPNQTSTPVSQNHTPPLPQTFNGVNIDMFRQFSIMSVINRVLSNPQLFSQLLMQDQNMSMFRSSNPTEFDSIINHPGFLGSGIAQMQGSDDDLEGGMFPIDPSNNQETDPTNSNTGASSGRIILTQEEKQFINEISLIAPHISQGEIVQYYLICNRDKDATVEMVMNIPRD